MSKENGREIAEGLIMYVRFKSVQLFVCIRPIVSTTVGLCRIGLMHWASICGLPQHWRAYAATFKAARTGATSQKNARLTICYNRTHVVEQAVFMSGSWRGYYYTSVPRVAALSVDGCRPSVCLSVCLSVPLCDSKSRMERRCKLKIGVKESHDTGDP